jgi:hypothetical protein
MTEELAHVGAERPMPIPDPYFLSRYSCGRNSTIEIKSKEHALDELLP